MANEYIHYDSCECNISDGACPLDYPFKTAADKWHSENSNTPRIINFDRRQAMTLAKQFPYFKFLFSTHSPGESQSGCKLPDPRIELEFEPFFRDFILSYCNMEPDDRNNIFSNENPKFSEYFGKTFFKSAHNSIHGNAEFSIEGKPEELSYYEKMLYKHSAFQEFAAEYFWKAEFDKRCRLLKEAVLKCPPDRRLSGMPDILRFLDAQIGYYGVIAKRSKHQEKGQKETLQEFMAKFPDELQEFRGRNEYGYTFENIPIKVNEDNVEKTYSLNDLFFQYSRNVKRSKKLPPVKRKELLEASRKQFLQFLSKKVEECDAYTLAHQLDNYVFDPYVKCDPKKRNEIEIDL